MATKSRDELYELFYTGKKPTSDDFVDLIDSAINIEEDGIGASQPGNPMELLAQGSLDRFLDFAIDKDTPIWRISAWDKNKTNQGFNLSSGNKSRIFLQKAKALIGVNTDNPTATLHAVNASGEPMLRLDDSTGAPVLQVDANGNMGFGTSPENGKRLKLSGNVDIIGQTTVGDMLHANSGLHVSNAELTTDKGLTSYEGVTINTGFLDAKDGAKISGRKAVITNGAVLSNGTAVSDDILNSGIGLSVSNGATIESGSFEAKGGASIDQGLTVQSGITIHGNSTIESGLLTSKGGVSIIDHAGFSVNGEVTLGFKDAAITKSVSVNGPLIAAAGAEIAGDRLIARNGAEILGDISIGDATSSVTINGPVVAGNTLTVENAGFIASGSVSLGNDQTGNISVLGQLTASKGISVSGGSLIATGNAEVNTITIAGSASITGPVTLSDELNTTGSVVVENASLTANGAVMLGNSASDGSVTAMGEIIGNNGAQVLGTLTALGDVELGTTSIDSLDVNTLKINSGLTINTLSLSSLSVSDAQVSDLDVSGMCSVSNDVKLADGKISAVYRGPGTDQPRIITLVKDVVSVENGHFEISISADKAVTISGNSASDMSNFNEDWETYKTNNQALATGFQLARMGADNWTIRNRVVNLQSSGVAYKSLAIIPGILNVIYSGTSGTAHASVITDPDGEIEDFEFAVESANLTILIPYVTSSLSILGEVLSVRHSGSISESPQVNVILNTDPAIELFQFGITGTTLQISIPQDAENQTANQLLANWSEWKLANEETAGNFFIDQFGGAGTELVVETSGILEPETENHTVSVLQNAWSDWKKKNEVLAEDFELERIAGTGDEIVSEISGNLPTNTNGHVMFKGAVYTNTVSVLGHLTFGVSDIAVNNFSDDGTFNQANDYTVPTQNAVKTYVDERAFLAGRSDQSFTAENLTVFENFGFNAGHQVNEISNDGDLADSSTTAIPTEFAVRTYADTKAEKNGAGTEPFAAQNLTVHGSFGFFNGHTISEISNSFDPTNPRQTSLCTEYAIKSFVDTNLATINGHSSVDFNTRNLNVEGNLQLGTGVTVTKVTTNITGESDKDGSLPNATAIVDYVNEVTALNRANSALNYSTNDVTVDGNLKFNDNDLVVSKISDNIDGELNPTIAIPTVQAVRDYSDASKAPVNGHADNNFQTNDLNITGNLTFGANVLHGVSANINAESNATGTVPNVQAVKDHVDGKADIKLAPGAGLSVGIGSSAAAVAGLSSNSNGLVIVRNIVTGGATELGVFAVHGNSTISKVSGENSSYNLSISGSNLMVENIASAGITAYITFLGA